MRQCINTCLETYVRLWYNQIMKRILYKNRQRIRSIVVLAVILIAAGGMMVRNQMQETGSMVIITVNGREYERLPLLRDTQLTITAEDGSYNRIVITDGQAYVVEADCANQICVRSAPISQNGEVIACIPHGLLITVVRSVDEGVDALVK